MPRILLGLLLLLVSGKIWSVSATAPRFLRAAEVAPVGEHPPEPGSDLFEESPLPLITRRPRTADDVDALHATALLAHARMLMQRGDLGNALRRYQRAWRYNPAAVDIMERIVPLAFQSSVNRKAEGYRYAVIAADRGLSDPQLLTQLAVHLTRNNQPRRALRLYDRLWKIQQNKAPHLRWVVQHVEMGRLCLLLRDPARAVGYFEVVRKAIKDPDQFSISESQLKRLLGTKNATCLLLANGFLRGRQFAAALEMFEKADAGQPNPALLAFRRARVEAVRENVEAAMQQLEQYLQSGETAAGTGPYTLLHRLLRTMADDDRQAQERLQERLETLYKNQSENSVLGTFLAEQRRSQGRLEEAESLFQALRERQSSAELNRGLVNIYLKQADTERLYAMLVEIVADDPQLASLSGLPQQIVERDEGDVLDGLIEHTTQDLSDDAETAAHGAQAVAVLAAIAKRFDAADHWFATARRLGATQSATLYSNWGRRMYQAGRFPQAVDAFRGALQIQTKQDNHPLLYLLMADALVANQQLEAALDAVRKAKALKPDHVVAHSQIPWILYRGKRFADAKRQYLAFLDKFDSQVDNEQIRRICRQARFILSTLSLREGNFPEAERWLEEVLDEFPEDVGAFNDLGYLWADRDIHLQRALMMIQRAVAAEPDNTAYRDSLGWVYYRLGRYADAVRELEKAAGQTADGVILDHLGDAYSKLQQPDKAQAAWRRALAVFEEQDDTQQVESVRTKIQNTDS